MEESAITLVSVTVTLAGIVAWILKSAGPALLKQYRDDVFDLQGRNTTALREAIAEFRAENKALADRYDRELTRRDALLDRISAVIEQMGEKLRLLQHQIDELDEDTPLIPPFKKTLP